MLSKIDTEIGGVEKHRFVVFGSFVVYCCCLRRRRLNCLTSKAIEGASLPLESIDHIKGSDGLTTSMLSVGDSITDDVLKEDLEDSPGLLIDEARDTLDTTTTSETANSRLQSHTGSVYEVKTC